MAVDTGNSRTAMAPAGRRRQRQLRIREPSIIIRNSRYRPPNGQPTQMQLQSSNPTRVAITRGLTLHFAGTLSASDNPRGSLRIQTTWPASLTHSPPECQFFRPHFVLETSIHTSAKLTNVINEANPTNLTQTLECANPQSNEQQPIKRTCKAGEPAGLSTSYLTGDTDKRSAPPAWSVVADMSSANVKISGLIVFSIGFSPSGSRTITEYCVMF